MAARRREVLGVAALPGAVRPAPRAGDHRGERGEDDGPYGRSCPVRRRATNPEGNGEIELVHRVVHADGNVLWLHLRSRTTFEQREGRPRPLRTWGSVMAVPERQQLE